MCTTLLCRLRRLLKARKGNVTILFALAAPVVVLLTGMTVDYTMAASRRDQLDAVADAAALAAVTPEMMNQNDAASVTAAQDAFNAQASAIGGITYNSSDLHVAVADTATTRTVTVSYTAASQNTFAKLLGMSTIPLGGSSQAVATAAPNVDFYMLLDSSPSMEIVATQAGITTMKNATPTQEGGCSFACHETNPAADNLGNPPVCVGGSSPPTKTTTTSTNKWGKTTTTTTWSCSSGTLVQTPDNFTYATTATAGGGLGLTLRIDMLRSATQSLMTTAQTTASNNHAVYRMGIYTFDVNFNTIQSLTSDLSTAQTSAANIQPLTVYTNNYLTQGNYNDDEDTNYDNAMSTINTTMPAPGNGSNATGDTPQEVLFIVTDGVGDENVNGGRQYPLMPLSQCTAIKNRGIRIAILYTNYFPLTGENWYDTYIAPIEPPNTPNIATDLQSCASPGLYFEVDNDADISNAMSDLFESAVKTARLTR